MLNRGTDDTDPIVYLHYVEGNTISEDLATVCYQSFVDCGWSVERVKGYTRFDTNSNDLCIIPHGRLHTVMDIYDREIFLTKIAILQNHIRFWRKISSGNNIGIYAEHDVVCQEKYNTLPSFKDVLILNLDNLNLDSHLKYYAMSLLEDYKLPTVSEGVHPLPEDWPWVNCEHEYIYKGSKMIPTASCYAITPQGASKILEAIDLNGADQGDFNINSYVLDLNYISPPVVKYSGRSTTTSLHGDNYD